MHKRINAFHYAFEGISVAFRDQPNIRLHLLAAAVAVLFAFLFGISYFEWMVLSLTIGLVIFAELANTAIEEIVNSFTPNQHPSAKKAKDVAAAAVLVCSITALFVGILIFAPHIIMVLSRYIS